MPSSTSRSGDRLAGNCVLGGFADHLLHTETQNHLAETRRSSGVFEDVSYWMKNRLGTLRTLSNKSMSSKGSRTRTVVLAFGRGINGQDCAAAASITRSRSRGRRCVLEWLFYSDWTIFLWARRRLQTTTFPSHCRRRFIRNDICFVVLPWISAVHF